MSTNDQETAEAEATKKLEAIYAQMFKLAGEVQQFFDGKTQVVVSGAIRILMLNMEDHRPKETLAADQIVRSHIKKESLKKRLEELTGGPSKIPR